MFLPGAKGTRFAQNLEALVEVLEPMAKTITCLESTHSTVSDVYVFWLACMASVCDVISMDRYEMGAAVTEGIRHRMNAR